MAAVFCVQQVLADDGFDLGASGVDSDVGGHTDSAVRGYQSSRHVGVDGEVGPTTGGRMASEQASRRDFDRRAGESQDLSRVLSWESTCAGKFTEGGRQIFRRPTGPPAPAGAARAGATAPCSPSEADS